MMTPFYGKPNLLPLTRRLLRGAEVGHLRPHQHVEVMPLQLTPTSLWKGCSSDKDSCPQLGRRKHLVLP